MVVWWVSWEWDVASELGRSRVDWVRRVWAWVGRSVGVGGAVCVSVMLLGMGEGEGRGEE